MSLLVQDLVYTYPGEERPALQGVSMRVEPGEIVALAGPDGAGKTTLVRLLAGLLKSSAGRVSVLGRDPVADHAALSPRIGYMPQKFGLYEDLTVAENMKLYAALHNVTPLDAARLGEELLRSTHLDRFASRLAGKLSGGMKQKLGLVCAMYGAPEVLLLDEPGVGVDPLSRRELWKMVENLRRKGLAILWATSYLDEAARCDRVCLLHEGSRKYEGKPDDLLAPLEHRVVRLTGGKDGLLATLRRVQRRPDVIDAVIESGHLRALLGKPYNPDDWSGEEGVCPVKPAFEEAFIDLLGGGRRRLPAQDAVPAWGEELPERGTPAIVTRGLTRRFGDFTATDHLSIEVQAGEIFGLLGPNGAGKTTSFRMMCGLLKPSEGTATILGIDLSRQARRARQRIGYMAQKFSLYGTLSVLQNLRFFAGIYGLHGREKTARIEEATREFSLGSYLGHASGSLPLGIRQRLSLACAVLHRPAFLFLDEPTSGVDPLARREFWERINAMAEQGVTVVVTTHFMDEAQYLHRMAVIDRGRMIALGSPDEIKAEASSTACPDPTMEEAFIALIEKGGRA